MAPAVVVNDLGSTTTGEGTDAGPAQQVVDEIRAAGGKAVASTDSVATWESANRIIKTAVEAFGRIDIVVNNAGILRDKSFAKMEPEDFAKVVGVHLTGTFNCCKAVWEGMRERNYGRIVLTTSSSGLFGNFGQANYAAAKLGIVGLSKSIALDMSRSQLEPGKTMTALFMGLSQLFDAVILDHRVGEQLAAHRRRCRRRRCCLHGRSR